MTDVVSFDPKSRYGKTAERWGNLLLPEGAAHIDTLFAFEGQPEATYRVLRVNVFPQDPKKRLYYYLRTERQPEQLLTRAQEQSAESAREARSIFR